MPTISSSEVVSKLTPYQHNLQKNYSVGFWVYPLLICGCTINLFINFWNRRFRKNSFVVSPIKKGDCEKF